VRLPAVGQLRQRQHLRDRGLAHLRRARQHHEPMPGQNPSRPLVRPRRPKHLRQLLSTRDIQRRAIKRPGVDQRRQIPQPQHRRQRGAQVRVAVETRRDLPRADHLDGYAPHERIPAQRGARAARIEVREHNQPVRFRQAGLERQGSHPIHQLRQPGRQRPAAANPHGRHRHRPPNPDSPLSQYELPADNSYPSPVRLTPPAQIRQASLGLHHQRAQAIKLQPAKLIRSVRRHRRR
jgi:hypothetical protein